MYSDLMDKDLDSLLCKQIISFFRGTGKSTAIINLAIDNFRQGKKVAIISNHPHITKDQLNGIPIDVIDSDKILKWLYEMRQNFSGNDIIDLNFKTCPFLKHYDQIIVEPNLYEDIIRNLQEKLDKIKKGLQKW